MAYPLNGLLKIYPSTVTRPGFAPFSLNNQPFPQLQQSDAALKAYYDLRVPNIANAPCMPRDTEIPAASGIYVPPPNTYELKFNTSSIGIEFYDTWPGTPVATLDFLSSNFPTMLNLNGGGVYIEGRIFVGAARDRIIDNSVKYNFNNLNIYDLIFSIPGLNNFSVVSPTNAMIPMFQNWSIIELMQKNFGVTLNCSTTISANSGQPQGIISECSILASYNTTAISFTTTTPNVSPGGIAQIDDAGGTLNIFDQDEFKIYWDTLEGETDVNPLFPGWTGGVIIPRDLILTFTPYQFKFIMPNNLYIPYGGRRLMLTGNSNSLFYIGEYPMQNFNIQLEDGSGLYKLVENQVYDTYYDRSVSPIDTIDLKIPDPYVKTAFFGS